MAALIKISLPGGTTSPGSFPETLSFRCRSTSGWHLTGRRRISGLCGDPRTCPRGATRPWPRPPPSRSSPEPGRHQDQANNRSSKCTNMFNCIEVWPLQVKGEYYQEQKLTKKPNRPTRWLMARPLGSYLLLNQQPGLNYQRSQELFLLMLLIFINGTV